MLDKSAKKFPTIHYIDVIKKGLKGLTPKIRTTLSAKN